MTPTEQRAAFVAAIQASPADAGLRLTFADWLDEHNEPHAAEWLRVDVALSEYELADDPAMLSGEALEALDERWRRVAERRPFPDCPWHSRAVRGARRPLPCVF